MEKKTNTIIIDGMETHIGTEENLLELIRRAGIELPTFCYHSEISAYGACRMCMVDIAGRGLQTACSTTPEPGMIVKTNTSELLSMRKMIVELMLASHQGDCPTCTKGNDCQLQTLARRFGIRKIRFNKDEVEKPIDDSSAALIRDPGKCVLCGDCVRICSEVQGIGAIDFAYRGSKSAVLPSFDKTLNEVECVYCGQCARVCPTGALTPKSQTSQVWKALHEKDTIVVAQIAPAVRISLGEMFGLEPGTTSTGRIIGALRRIGFDKVYDTSFAADLTIFEESGEFLERYKEKGNLPQFTSCCPAWVKYVEQFYPEFIPNLSSCRSPQQMMGSIVKSQAKDTKKTVMVSIMPCTAKKYEAQRPEFTDENGRHVDYVMTTQELGLMIEEMGLRFNDITPESFDMPYGFKTGGGVIFGNSGGVSEAVLRYVSGQIGSAEDDNYEFRTIRGEDGLREIEIDVADTTLRFAVASGLGNAEKLLERVKKGEAEYDFIEVMACPGGCINGGGQPVSRDVGAKEKRTCGLYDNDKMLQLHKPQENPYIQRLYKDVLETPGSKLAHDLLHTSYSPKRRINESDVRIIGTAGALPVTICLGTGCFIRGSQKLMQQLTSYLEDKELGEMVDVKATFCHEKCERGPVVSIDGEMIEKATFEDLTKAIEKSLAVKKEA